MTAGMTSERILQAVALGARARGHLQKARFCVRVVETRGERSRHYGE